jgi:predicted kinase
MGHVIIMSGVSGSGKSTLARKLVDDFVLSGRFLEDSKIVSADNYFLMNNEYRFDPAKLSEAHNECFASFIYSLRSGYNLVVVDNTNTTNEEIAPYYLGATAFGYTAEIITISADKDDLEELEILALRNKHNVPLKLIQLQANLLASRQLLPWWKQSVVPPEG